MNKILIGILLTILICLSGCINAPVINVIPVVNVTPVSNVTSIVNITPINTTIPEIVSDFNLFSEFLIEDNVSENEFKWDKTKAYSDNYLCAHFTRDLIISARKAGYRIYPAHLKGTTTPGEYVWHMITVVKINKKWYFVDPQTDVIINIPEAYSYFGYEYAYIGKDVLIGRNNADLDGRIRNEPGLVNEDFIYLKGLAKN